MTAEAPLMEAPLVEARGLHTWFELRQWGFLRVGAVRAVDDVSFTLARGEAVAFVGESGCGKSSLVRTLLGLHRPTAGEVRCEGRDLAALGGAELKAWRARVGYVQQDPFGALPPFLDVRRILAEPLKVHGVSDRAERERRIRAALEEVRLTPVEEFLGKFPHMLSGGQQQRVVIARALILEPALVIADEPVSMLDASVRVEILELLRGIQRQRGLTLAFVTHDLATVRHYAERIFVLYAGKVVESAPVEALLDAPEHPYTRALLGVLSDPDAANATRQREVPPGEPPSLIGPPAGCRFHPRCARAIAGRCEVEAPPEVATAPERRVACWLYDDKALRSP
ncbi:ABC transporter ATP-binding protein [uncultured Halomonas sp.]|uniref:ABC transporter ATP-binding protein n=1 Tax=uncultured Halomonas sp. TaxID=173971 RepID=UPI0026223CCC|nr:ABC transporter ATP-binding protein [uncultured Halomonas sp.]